MDCGGFSGPEGHLDTQMFPDCPDRTLTKQKHKKKKTKKCDTCKKSEVDFPVVEASVVKKEEISENVVPVSQILGTPSGANSEEAIDQKMHEQGYFLFRESYPFGRLLSYRNKMGDKVYLLNSVWSTWSQVVKDARDTWRPVRQDDVAWYNQNIG
jgi:hypothetical protein